MNNETATTYQGFKKETETETNNFLSKYAFFAFMDSQFKEGIEKLKLTRANAKEKLLSIGGGGYILKEKNHDFWEMTIKHNQQLERLMKNQSFAVQAFRYELNNHEFCITSDTTDTIESLCLTVEEVKNSEHLSKCLKLAMRKS